jgi:hypothetical protein
MSEKNEASPLDCVVIWLRERKHKKQYVYGRVFRPEDGYYRENVRLNRQTKRVEFVLWKAGEQGHAADCWHEMGYGWEDYFQPYNNPSVSNTVTNRKGQI